MKRINKVIMTLLMSSFVFTLLSCNGNAKLFIPETSKLESINSTLDKDEGFVIDGKRNETSYKNPLSFTETSSNIDVTTYVHLGEKGAYFFVEVTDKSVYISSEKQFYENDSIELYIDPNPEYSITKEALNQTKVRNDCLHIRANCLGQYQTWYGRTMSYDPSGYPWVLGYFKAEVAGQIDGTLNSKDKANGYSVEVYIPWSEFNLNSKPNQIGVLPAFNNVSNREDNSRKWFSLKGMSHSLLSSYGRVDDNGFVDVGYSKTPMKTLSCNKDDDFYSDSYIYELFEVDKNNKNPDIRASLKATLGKDAMYVLVSVKDKVYTSGSDNIWSNDGIELVIDSDGAFDDNLYKSSIRRIGIDIDKGVETDICVEGYNDYVPYRQAVFANTKVEKIDDEGLYEYKYEYTYEVAIPYSTLGLNKKPGFISFSFAVQSPNEIAYILNRKGANGMQEGQSWLWIDKHYPLNTSEYFLLKSDEDSSKHYGSEIDDLVTNKIVSDVPERYLISALASDDGLSIEMVQFVDSFVIEGNASNKWNEKTHVEFEVWNEFLGYGWDGTYFAIFCNGDYYINNTKGVKDLKVSVDIEDCGEANDGYRYSITYKMFIGFENNINSSDGPYAFVKFYSFTPNEKYGYPSENVTYRDNRLLYSDVCKSYEIRTNGIVGKRYS